jgi:RNA polymerase sigma-70 factor, ECF subfamily
MSRSADTIFFRGAAWTEGLLLSTTAGSISPVSESAEMGALIQKAGRGDRNSFEVLAAQYLRFISREIAKVCPTDALSDVGQEVLLRLYQALPKYHHKGSFQWWLKKIISRACLDYWRNERRVERISERYLETSAGQAALPADDNLLLEELGAFLQTLSADDRVVFNFAFLEDLPHKEVAELLGISQAAVRVRCFRLKRKARKWFKL